MATAIRRGNRHGAGWCQQCQCGFVNARRAQPEQGSTAEPAVVTPAAPPEASPRKSTPAPVVDVPDELLVECKVENCIGQAFVDKDTDMFRCPVCNYYTCLKCMVVHQSLTCEQYRQNKEGGVPSPVYKPPKQPNEESDGDTDGEDEEQKVDDEAEGRIVDCCYEGCTGYSYVKKTATMAQCEKCNHWTCIACKASHESQSCAVYKGIEEPPEDEHQEWQTVSRRRTGARPKERKDGRNGAHSSKNNSGFMSKIAGAVGNLLGKTSTEEGEVAEDMRVQNYHGANGFGPRAGGYGGYRDPYDYKKVPEKCEACTKHEPRHVAESCEHALCQHCILNALKKSTTRYVVRCPVKMTYVEQCSGLMHISEVKQFVPAADLKIIEKKSNWERATCLNKECHRDCEIKKNMKKFLCLRCFMLNCLDCQVIHEGTCEQYIRKFVADLDSGRLEDPKEKQRRFEEQIKLYEQDCVLTTKEFECPVCLVEVEPGEGIRLRNCHHEICKQCLAESAKNSPSAEVKCPSLCGDKPCEMPVLDTDIRACLSAEDYQALQERGLREAENSGKEPSFHCKTPDCKGWCVYTREAQVFDCPICNQQNCLGCEAIHKDMNCADYQADLKRRAENDSAARASLNFLEELLKSGQAMRCPQCRVVIIKRSGCDYMVCTSCKTQLCWATKGARWGPNGPGDTSGGCRCGVNGVKCHPECTTCH
ncbi:uncharacterized protein LOC144155872 isoform X3 [Haemaphysalis longicornis]